MLSMQTPQQVGLSGVLRRGNARGVLDTENPTVKEEILQVTGRAWPILKSPLSLGHYERLAEKASNKTRHISCPSFLFALYLYNIVCLARLHLCVRATICIGSCARMMCSDTCWLYEQMISSYLLEEGYTCAAMMLQASASSFLFVLLLVDLHLTRMHPSYNLTRDCAAVGAIAIDVLCECDAGRGQCQEG
jgi:hypothetical protein